MTEFDFNQARFSKGQRCTVDLSTPERSYVREGTVTAVDWLLNEIQVKVDGHDHPAMFRPSEVTLQEGGGK